MKQFMPEAHPLYTTNDEIQKTFALTDGVPIFATLSLSSPRSKLGVDPNPTDDWLSTRQMEKLKAATEQARALDGVRSAVSIATVEGAGESNGNLTVGRLTELLPPDHWRERFLNDALMSPSLISKDGLTANLVIELKDGIETFRAEQIITTLRQSLRDRFKDATVSVGGAPAIQSDMSKLLSQELLRFLGWASLACLFAVFIFFRGWSAIVTCSVVVVVSNIWALAYLSSCGIPFTLLSTTLPVLVSTTALAMATHTLLVFSEMRHDHVTKSKQEIVVMTLRRLLLPNFLVSLTTSVGFATLGISDVPLIRQYGWSVCWSQVLVWMACSLLLPALMYLLPTPQARSALQSRSPWVIPVLRNRRGILIVTLSLVAIALATSTQLNWSVRLFDDMPETAEARRTTEIIDREMGGGVPLEIELSAQEGETDVWNDPERLRSLRELEARWRLNHAVGSAMSVSDFLDAAHISNHAQAERKANAETIFLYGFADENPLSHFLTPDGNKARIAFRLKDLPAEETKVVVAQIVDDFKKSFPGFKIRAGGVASITHAMNEQLSRQLISGLWQSLVLITLILMLIFRSLRWALVAAVPNLLAPVALMAAMSVLKTPIKPGIALIFSIALGIAYNNTVYVLERLKNLRKNSSYLPVARAWHEEGNPCLLSTLALFAGFAVFLSSQFTLNRVFGGYMLLSLFSGLVGDLIFLPALLKSFPSLLGTLPPVATVSHLSVEPLPKESSMMEKIAAGIAIFTLFSSPTAKAGQLSADQILSEVEKRVGSHDESARIIMTIGEANGSSKNREIEIRRKADGGQKVLVKLQSPADLRGTSLLSVSGQGQEDQWLYLPSSKQTRRIVSSKRNSSFLDSELSYEDMGSAGDKKFTSTVLKNETDADGQVAVIESKLVSGDSAYSRMVTWVSMKSYLAKKIEYYDHAGKLLKVSELKAYAKFGKDTWRAQDIQVHNVQNNRTTRLQLKDLKVNNGIDDQEFTVTALADE